MLITLKNYSPYLNGCKMTTKQEAIEIYNKDIASLKLLVRLDITMVLCSLGCIAFLITQHIPDLALVLITIFMIINALCFMAGANELKHKIDQLEEARDRIKDKV